MSSNYIFRSVSAAVAGGSQRSRSDSKKNPKKSWCHLGSNFTFDAHITCLEVILLSSVKDFKVLKQTQNTCTFNCGYSRLDCRASLLHTLAEVQNCLKIQQMQICLSRIVTKSPKHSLGHLKHLNSMEMLSVKHTSFWRYSNIFSCFKHKVGFKSAQHQTNNVVLQKQCLYLSLIIWVIHQVEPNCAWVTQRPCRGLRVENVKFSESATIYWSVIVGFHGEGSSASTTELLENVFLLTTLSVPINGVVR